MFPMKRLATVALNACVTLLGAAPRQARQTGDPFVILIVVDGLRPDVITPDLMPNLSRLRSEGTEYVNSHSAIPTVTRVNGAVITTGRWQSATGILSNSPYIASFDSLRALNTADANAMRALAVANGNRLVAPKTLAEYVASAGKRFVSVNAGSGGNALFSNPRAPFGEGILINANLSDAQGSLRVAYPDSISRALIARFGPPPSDSAEQTLNRLQSWSDRIIREYVLRDLRPAVIATWTAEPDESQHRYGVSSPQARDALANVDRDVGLLIATIDSLGLRTRANLIVTSDHGFALHDASVNVVDSLIAAGLKASRTSSDIILTGDGQSLQLFVARRDPALVRRLATYLESKPWVDGIFARDSTVAGTFPLHEVHLDHPDRAPDLLISFPWSEAANQFGAPGAQMIAGRASGALTGSASGHGGLNPYTIHNTLILWGPAFRQRTRVSVPAGTVDITPTILDVVGIRGLSGFDGRVLREAFVGGVDPSTISTRTFTRAVNGGGFERRVQFTEIVGGERYVDRAWRAR
ncbi:MAG TPA: alkaline phosphatase family protein [Gemmatimonadaceae bacterium]|jgi:predicted AlkP superfamily pyrophosphatase or phosphodiesterase